MVQERALGDGELLAGCADSRAMRRAGRPHGAAPTRAGVGYAGKAQRPYQIFTRRTGSSRELGGPPSIVRRIGSRTDRTSELHDIGHAEHVHRIVERSRLTSKSGSRTGSAT